MGDPMLLATTFVLFPLVTAVPDGVDTLSSSFRETTRFAPHPVVFHHMMALDSTQPLVGRLKTGQLSSRKRPHHPPPKNFEPYTARAFKQIMFTLALLFNSLYEGNR